MKLGGVRTGRIWSSFFGNLCNQYNIPYSFIISWKVSIAYSKHFWSLVFFGKYCSEMALLTKQDVYLGEIAIGLIDSLSTRIFHCLSGSLILIFMLIMDIIPKI